jgi:ubiquinone/menaquinone biosynthesis C-methylase UbiE
VHISLRNPWDFAALRSVPERLGRPSRVLDVACGMGILLKELLECMPGIEVYGVDASTDMLTQARIALKGRSRVQLEQVEVGAGETAKLPYARGSLISSPARTHCTICQIQWEL